MSGDVTDVSAHARLCFEYGPPILDALEKMLGCSEALSAECSRAAPDDDRFHALMEECGGADLDAVLVAFAGRICHVTGENMPVPLDADKARELVAEIAGRYGTAR